MYANKNVDWYGALHIGLLFVVTSALLFFLRGLCCFSLPRKIVTLIRITMVRAW